MKPVCTAIILFFSIAINGIAQTPAQTIPSFTFKRLNQKEFSNKDLAAGKLIFFVFFDTECDHCQRSVQYIGSHYAEFKKAAIYLITLADTDKIKSFMKKYGSGLSDKKNVTLLQDSKNEFIQKFGPRKYPSLFLYSARKELMLYEDDEGKLPSFIEKINGSDKQN